jgi:hypothetical protein
MELRDFVAQTLVQVVEGVAAAQQATAKMKATVSPDGIGYASANPQGLVAIHHATSEVRVPDLIEFDVAVTTTEAEQVSGGGGIFVGAIALGSKAEAESGSQAVNRIRFTVPLLLPKSYWVA